MENINTNAVVATNDKPVMHVAGEYAALGIKAAVHGTKVAAKETKSGFTSFMTGFKSAWNKGE